MKNRKIGIIGAPSSAGARRVGQERSPTTLREAGLISDLESAGFEVIDLGDTATFRYSPDVSRPRAQNMSAVASIAKEVATMVESALDIGAWPIVLGGDCTISIGALAALALHTDKPGLIYLDGDLDLNTPETTISGILDGMVLAHILGRGSDELHRVSEKVPLVNEENVILFGYSEAAGGIDAIEKAVLSELAVQKYPMEKVLSKPISMASKAVDLLKLTSNQAFLHFDVDVLDFDEFPAADVPHRPGLSISVCRKILHEFARHEITAGIAITEFNADRDPTGRLAHILKDLVVETARIRCL